MIKEFIQKTKSLEVQAHLEHLATKKYSKHVCLQNLYEELNDLFDRFVESHIGLYGHKMEDSLTLTLSDPIYESIKNYRQWLAETEVEDKALSSIQDEILELCSKTLYLLNLN